MWIDAITAKCGNSRLAQASFLLLLHLTLWPDGPKVQSLFYKRNTTLRFLTSLSPGSFDSDSCSSQYKINKGSCFITFSFIVIPVGQEVRNRRGKPFCYGTANGRRRKKKTLITNISIEFGRDFAKPYFKRNPISKIQVWTPQ